MSTPLSSVFPRPSAEDADDVVWTLQTAAVQWQRGLRADAIVWVRKAADTAIQVGQAGRAEELREHAARLAEFLWTDPQEAAAAAALGLPLDLDDDVIEIDDLDDFQGDAPAPPPRAGSPELSYYGDDDVESEANVLPQDLDLRSDSDEPGVRDSFMSVSPEPEGPSGRDSYASISPESEGPSGRDSYASISPESEGPPGRDSYASISPESEGPSGRDSYASVSPEPQGRFGRDSFVSVSPEPEGPHVSIHPEPGASSMASSPTAISERPTQPRISKLSALDRAPPGVTAESPRLPTMPSPAATPPPDPSRPYVPSESPVTISRPNSKPGERLTSSLPPEPDSSEADGQPAEAARVDGLLMETVEALADLPEEAQAALSASAELVMLSAGEQIALRAGAALVTRGGVDVTLTSSDVSAARVGKGTVIPVHGSMDTIALRLIANEMDTRVVRWSEEQVGQATRACPWVVDDLRLAADRYQAYAGAGLGPLGARLDDALRAAVYEQLDVRVLEPGELVAQRGKPLGGLFVVAVGELAMSGGGTIRAGEFVFPGSVIGAELPPDEVRAGPAGGLVLYAPRPVAHELMMSVPPLLEILAS